MTDEWQCGDAQLNFEQLTFDANAVDRKRTKEDRAAFEPQIQNFPKLLVEQASAWVGKSRAKDRGEITKLLSLFDLPFESDGKPVPFCAAGASYVASTVYARARASRTGDAQAAADLAQFLGDVDHYHFGPSPSVWDMFYLAKGKRHWHDAKAGFTPPPGWLVIFDFGKGADHVGIVDRSDKGSISTI